MMAERRYHDRRHYDSTYTIFAKREMSFIKEYVVGDLIENWDFYECDDFNDEVIAKKYGMSIDKFQELKSKLT